MRGDQRIARGCYATTVKEAMHITSLDLREDSKRGRQEPVEDLEEVALGQGDLEKNMKVGMNLEKELKQRLVECLRAHTDVFAWTHKDMPRIDLNVTCH